ncbi:hypothetical protein [Streptomyces sp. AK02-01A]|uniref:hypothetical protein n=1 Tax=Streptomyces sp. AK02-01A TaxID=3028648 RepID=UPI0039F6AF2A
MTIAQVNLLAALGKVGPCAPSKLGDVLRLERSTVSRLLGVTGVNAVQSVACCMGYAPGA